MTQAKGTVRVAAVDMGSNTTRLIVADVTAGHDGTLTHEVLARRSTITRLAEQVDARGILLPQAITRVRSALIDYRREAQQLGAVFVLATATSAVRDADNGEAFLGEVEHGFGFRAELLSGSQEAQITWAGVTSDAETSARAGATSGLLVDIGGGSTEIVLTEAGQIVDHHSFQLGSVRLTERFLHDDPPTSAQLGDARAYALQQLEQRFPNPAVPGLGVAVAGSATTISAIRLGLASYDPDRVHGSTISVQDAAEVVAQLAALPIAMRKGVVGLEPQRAPVILGGLLTMQAVLAHFGLAQVLVSERDILDGIALRAGRIALDEGISELPQPFGRTVC